MYLYVIVVSRRLLPVQTNTDAHDPEFCRNNFTTFVDITEREIRCPTAEFEPAPPTVSISSRCGDFQKLLVLKNFRL